MVTTAPRSAPALAPAEGRVFSVAKVLAAVGVVFLAWQAWTLVAWLADGPQAVTQFRDPDHYSWKAARVYEGLAAVMAVGVLTYLVRSCRREGRLTLDAKICIGGAASLWLDPLANGVAPIFFYNSNWVNLATWAGHTPFVINPDAGRMAHPVLFLGLVYTFGLLVFAMIINAMMRAMRRRWPGLSTARMFGLAALGGIAVDIAFEVPMYLLRLWAYPGAPDELAIFGGRAVKFPLIEILGAAMIFMSVALLRWNRDDRGRALVERGLGPMSPRRAGWVSVLAVIGLFNTLFLVGDSAEMVVGFYSDPYHPGMPAHLVNDLCDAPGVEGTRYGPCPGSPGFRLPVRDMPGPKPYQD
ncbi:MAG: spirocyclase AveC family protein [Acidimicrobiia bacterium]